MMFDLKICNVIKSELFKRPDESWSVRKPIGYQSIKILQFNQAEITLLFLYYYIRFDQFYNIMKTRSKTF